MGILALSPGILLSVTDEGYVAYDTQLERFHELNPTAALLIELCDGKRSTSEVIELCLPLIAGGNRKVLESWFKEAISVDLLQEPKEGGSTQVAAELSATQLDDLAQRLRDAGKIRAAYLCLVRANEIESENPARLRRLGEIAHIAGKRDEARTAYEKYFQLEPSDAEVEHLLTSLRNETPPTRVPSKCIEQLYKRFSDFYEENMCEELGYEGPVHLAEALSTMLEGRNNLKALDLGCGTGLSGAVVAPISSRLIGVDLSAEMLLKAEKTHLYQELHHSEITDWLQNTTDHFDCIIACDTLIYFGDLSQVLGPAAERLTPEGFIGFSVEQNTDSQFQLTDNGRYKHSERHIRDVAANLNLAVAVLNERFIRMEYGREVIGYFVVLSPESSRAQASAT